jgi:endoglucanase
VTRRLRGRAARAIAATVLAATPFAGCGTDGSGDGSATASNGVLGTDTRFFVRPTSSAARAVSTLRAERRTEEAEKLMRLIADRPTATWLTPVQDSVYSEARGITEAAAAEDQLPVLVAYNLPGRDCGQYSSGGASGIDDYLQWVGSLAAGVGDRAALVILEPDALPHTLQGCNGSQSAAERFRMLDQAVRILRRQPQLRVYVDAGNASWIKDLDALASALRSSGVTHADGFALNVSNFETNEASESYGARLSSRLGDAHFVLDSSRNGDGPPRPGSSKDPHRTWCNPVGVRLGTPPTTHTGNPLVDAYLWVKQPGDSDGTCGDGAPAAGRWWPRYATELMGGAT